MKVWGLWQPQSKRTSKGQLMSFGCLHFLPKNERKQVNLWIHSSKVEFIRSFFGGNVGLKNTFRLCLTFSNNSKSHQIDELNMNQQKIPTTTITLLWGCLVYTSAAWKWENIHTCHHRLWWKLFFYQESVWWKKTSLVFHRIPDSGTPHFERLQNFHDNWEVYPVINNEYSMILKIAY